MALRSFQEAESVSPFVVVDGPDALISSGSTLPPPIGTGCMACCSGGVDPTWGGVSSASTVAI